MRSSCLIWFGLVWFEPKIVFCEGKGSSQSDESIKKKKKKVIFRLDDQIMHLRVETTSTGYGYEYGYAISFDLFLYYGNGYTVLQ